MPATLVQFFETNHCGRLVRPLLEGHLYGKKSLFDGSRPHSGLFILQFYISVIVKVLCQNTKGMPTVDVGSGKLQNVKVKETGIFPLNLMFKGQNL